MHVIFLSCLLAISLVVSACAETPAPATPVTVVDIPKAEPSQTAPPVKTRRVAEVEIFETTPTVPDVRLTWPPPREVRRMQCGYVLIPTGQRFEKPILARAHAERLGYSEADIELTCSFNVPSP